AATTTLVIETPELDDRVVIRPGDTLWDLAHNRLTRTGQPDDDAAIESYVADIVATNEAMLVNPYNPDLILPGQTFDFPATPEHVGTTPAQDSGDTTPSSYIVEPGDTLSSIADRVYGNPDACPTIWHTHQS